MTNGLGEARSAGAAHRGSKYRSLDLCIAILFTTRYSPHFFSARLSIPRTLQQTTARHTMQRPPYQNPPPAHSPPLHHPVPQHVSTVPQLRSPPPPQPPSQPHSAYGYAPQGGAPGQPGPAGYNIPPSFGGFINDPTAQLGYQMGRSAVGAGQAYVEQNVCPLSFSVYRHRPL
jgi:hypothetical protein